MKKLMMAVGAAMFAGASMAATSFAYQGLLLNEQGGTTGQEQAVIDFKLYTQQSDGTAVWGRNVSVKLATNGLFNVELSDSSGTASVGLENAPSLDKVIEASQNGGLPLYIGLKVAGSAGEIRPRQKLIPTPMTAFAQNVAKAKGNFEVASNAVVKGSLAVDGVMSATTAEVEKKLTVKSEAVFQNGLTVSAGAVSIGGDINVNGKFTVNNVEPGVPIGCIVMWSGATTKIPAGWGLCDGSQYGQVSSPDLRGRFIVGMNYECTDQNLVNHKKKPELSEYDIKATGGKESVKLDVSEMPVHSHETKTWNRKVDGGSKNNYWVTTFEQGLESEYTKFASSSAGGSGDTPVTKAHENRPPYFALCFIIKYQ